MIEFLSFVWPHLDWLAMAFILFGYFRMSAFKVDGWVWTCLGSILLVIFGTLAGALGVAAGNMVFVGLTIYGFIKWQRNENVQN